MVLPAFPYIYSPRFLCKRQSEKGKEKKRERENIIDKVGSFFFFPKKW